jgi:hypothetical protein
MYLGLSDLSLRQGTPGIGSSGLSPSWQVTPTYQPSGMVYTGNSLRTQVNQDGSLGYGPHNLIVKSQDFTAVAWGKLASGTGVVPVVTPGFSDPFGGYTAARIQFSLGATPSGAVSRIFQAAANLNGLAGSNSVWLRTNDGTTKTLGMTGASDRIPIVVTSEWQRFALSSQGAYTQIQFGLYQTGTGTDETADILAAGPQVNFGAVQPYYPTDSAQYFGLRTADYSDSMAPVYSAELVANSEFNTGSGWGASGSAPDTSFTISGGVVTISRGAGSSVGGPSQTVAVVIGKLYEITIQGAGGANLVLGTSGADSKQTVVTAGVTTGVYRFVAASTSLVMSIWPQANNATGAMERVSVREITAYAGTRPGMKFEPPVTNLLTYSNDLSNAAWTKVNVTPAGSVLTNTSAFGFATQAIAGPLSSVTLSWRVKKTTGATTHPGFTVVLGGSTYYSAALNTNTGIATGRSTEPPTSVSVASAGAYWRISVTATGASGTVSAIVYPCVNVDGSAVWTGGTGSVETDGAQLESGAVATSYIATAASTVTRAADVLYWPTSAIPGYDATKGTLFVEAVVQGAVYAADYRGLVSINGGSGAQAVQMFTNNTTLFGELVVSNATVGYPAIGLAAVAGVSRKRAFSYSSAAVVLSSGTGVAAASAVPSGFPAGMTRLYLGSINANPVFNLNGTIYDARYYPTQLPSATLQALTA